MLNQDYQRLLEEEIFKPILKLTESKAHDYACKTDTLSNFKIQAKMQSALLSTNITASEIAFQFIMVKITRLNNLKDKAPQNESVKDTILDLVNYIGLYYACKLEEYHRSICATTAIFQGEGDVTYGNGYNSCSHPEGLRVVRNSTDKPDCIHEYCQVCGNDCGEL